MSSKVFSLNIPFKMLWVTTIRGCRVITSCWIYLSNCDESQSPMWYILVGYTFQIVMSHNLIHTHSSLQIVGYTFQIVMSHNINNRFINIHPVGYTIQIVMSHNINNRFIDIDPVGYTITNCNESQHTIGELMNVINWIYLSNCNESQHIKISKGHLE